MAKKKLLNNEIFTIDNILSPQECAEYINLTENIGYTDAPISTIRGFEMRPDIRNNQRVILDDTQRAFDLWQRVSNYIPSSSPTQNCSVGRAGEAGVAGGAGGENSSLPSPPASPAPPACHHTKFAWQSTSIIGRWQAVGLNERFRFYRYNPGQRFAIHHDGSYRRPNGEESLLTFMIYLNDGFEGGETRFHFYSRFAENLPSIAVVPVTGTALCFVHDLVHEGTAVIQGRKYVLRSDVMYRQHSKIL
ncbi:MAG: 2OG-Fe(II) oxygenase [Nostoc sp. TH1S01]|nr:2OG-Fe(II) oxygenase [Nostoc sp. TH1S01]